MANIWKPLKGVTISYIGNGTFLFRFYHQVDIQRVLKGGSWSFDRYMLILGVITEDENPLEIPLFNVPFWVQIHDLPLGFMSKRVGQNIGNYLGKFLEYDEKNFINFCIHLCRNPTAAGGSKYLRDGGNRGSDEPKTQTARDLEIQGINCRGTTTINANDLEIQKRVELMAEIFKNPKLIFSNSVQQ
ncbi:hypothetical protein GmHk_13G036490 [Glycine max]|nr:hypothetical protein GmHk_13G036490 [Glycine max]